MTATPDRIAEWLSDWGTTDAHRDAADAALAAVVGALAAES